MEDILRIVEGYMKEEQVNMQNEKENHNIGKKDTC